QRHQKTQQPRLQRHHHPGHRSLTNLTFVLDLPNSAVAGWFFDWLCAVGGLSPSGSSNTHEAPREVDDGGNAHQHKNPRAIHVDCGAASTHGLDYFANALAAFKRQKN
ncbi:hypothetical protein, partial [Arthrobacter sp. NPDC057009]|uniref:hypothetical protein n=1 Tax=Arthrobacter sp. NPDC057009 TaxID=3345996 RepID=UPI00362A3029